MESLANTALAVQQKRGATEREATLRHNLIGIQEEFMKHGSVRLPHHLGLEVRALQVSTTTGSCSSLIGIGVHVIGEVVLLLFILYSATEANL